MDFDAEIIRLRRAVADLTARVAALETREIKMPAEERAERETAPPPAPEDRPAEPELPAAVSPEPEEPPHAAA